MYMNILNYFLFILTITYVFVFVKPHSGTLVKLFVDAYMYIVYVAFMLKSYTIFVHMHVLTFAPVNWQSVKILCIFFYVTNFFQKRKLKDD